MAAGRAKPAILQPRLNCSPVRPRDATRFAIGRVPAEDRLHSNSSPDRGNRLKNIFVGNLDFNTGEDELRQLFEQYGPVDRVAIMTDRDTGRSRGFGFVEMTNTEDGEKAIAALNGAQLGGRTLNVNEARPKTERAGSGGGGRGRDRGGRGGGRW